MRAALPRAVAPALPITLGAWTVQAADIIQTAEQDGRFLQLLEGAGMVETLRGEGSTVFAPTAVQMVTSPVVVSTDQAESCSTPSR